LSLKTKVDGLSMILPQNHWDGFFRFDLKIGGYGFSDLTSKLMAMISWLSLKNKTLERFSVWVKNQAATIW
jgi:hypothetical protein